MKLFVFGLGYTARAYLAAHGQSLSAVTGTVRSASKALALRSAGLHATAFESQQTQHGLAQAEALLVSIPPGDGDPVLQRYRAALVNSNVSTIIYLSTVGVYADQNGGWVDEASPTTRNLDRARQRVEVEKEWLALGAEQGRRVIILRLAGIYGPGQSPLDKLRDGTARRIIKPGQVFNRIHVADIAQAIHAALHYTGAETIFNVSDDEPAPPQDVVAYAAELLNRPVPPDIPFDSAQLSPMGRSFYSKNQRVSNALLRRELGLNLLYPNYREGLKAILAQEMQSHPT